MGELPLGWQLPTVERLNKEAIEGETESAKVLSIQVEMPSGPEPGIDLHVISRHDAVALTIK